MLLMHGAAWLGLKAEGVSPSARAAHRHHHRDRDHGGLCPAGVCGWPSGSTAIAFAARSSPMARRTRSIRGGARGGSWLAAYAARPWIASPLSWALSAWRWRPRPARRARGVDAAVVEARHHRHDLDGRADDVPLHPALDRGSEQLAHRLGQPRSHQTLFIMLVVTAIFMPMILAYTAWVYKVLWGKVTEADVTANSDTVY
jgi:cytochrome d ubiquinol oxidase subunit II